MAIQALSSAGMLAASGLSSVAAAMFPTALTRSARCSVQKALSLDLPGDGITVVYCCIAPFLLVHWTSTSRIDTGSISLSAVE